jgi:glutaminyl-tRNA synthetase
MSKRRFIDLVKEGHVQGYDDPRLPTLAGLRRRGYTPEAIREFCRKIGVSKTDSCVEVAFLEDCVREDLNRRSPRAMAVLDPIKVVLVNYPEGQTEELDVINNPEAPEAGTRKVPFSRELFIERDDFREEPPPKFFRLSLGREVRLRNAYLVTCVEVVKDEAGEVTELRCTYDPLTRGGDAPDGRRVKATLHWVSAPTAVPAEVRLYDHLFSKPDPDDVAPGETYISNLNPGSVKVVSGVVEPGIADAAPGARYQFERLGYFCADPDSAPGKPVFNRTVTLRDTWAKIEKRGGK